MCAEVPEKRWLAELAAGLDGSGELAERAYRATASHLAQCTELQATALKAVLTAESAEIAKMLAQPRGADAVMAILRLRDIVEGALRAFGAAPMR
jgi:hypothetical protein